MSFDKAYPNRKDIREPYRNAKEASFRCRNHGGCPWCEGNRSYGTRKQVEAAEEQVAEVREEA